MSFYGINTVVMATVQCSLVGIVDVTTLEEKRVARS